MPAIGAIGYGVTLHVNDPGGATPTVADQLVAGIVNVTPPSPSRDIIDVTHSASPGMAREFIVGLIDYGEASFDLNWVPNDTTDAMLQDISLETAPRIWKMTFTQVAGSPNVTFDAYLTAYERTAPTEDKMTASITLKVTGAPVWA